MRRSEINKLAGESLRAINVRYTLPEWVWWTRAQWEDAKGYEEFQAGACGLDVTDFGSNNFLKQGLFLITLTNGVIGGAAPYCHKIMATRQGQICPFHTHYKKTEHIRVLKGKMQLRMYNDHPTGNVTVSVDGFLQEYEPNKIIVVKEGAAVCLLPGTYHEFAGYDVGFTILEEVSTSNDDQKDNLFQYRLPRFPEIIEDEKCRYPLVGDLQYFFQHGRWKWDKVVA